MSHSVIMLHQVILQVFFKFLGQKSLIMYSGRDISTGNTFDVQYEAPAGYSVINPISSIIRAIETKDTTNTGSAKTTAAENKVASAIFSTPGTTVDFSKFNPYSSASDSQRNYKCYCLSKICSFSCFGG